MLSAMKSEQGEQICTRPECVYKNDSDPFKINQKTYTQQFAGVYYSRLSKLKPLVVENAKKKWADRKCTYSERVLDVQTNALSWIVGTVFVDMPLKPNILNEIGQEHNIIVPPPREKYVSDNDTFLIEDESGRVCLKGDLLKLEAITTGIVVAVLGKEDGTGDFYVTDICYPGQSAESSNALVDDKWVALVSGLNFGNSTSCKLPLLFDYLSGELGTEKDQREVAEICRLVVAGDSLAKPTPVLPHASQTKSVLKSIGRTEYQKFYTEPLNMLDSYLYQVAENCQVDLIPGKNDPTSFALPQQPMHRSMFTKCNSLSSFTTLTNPYSFELDNINILVTSGQNLDDVYSFVQQCDRLEIASKILEWSHLAPTYPDTLAGYPFKDDDPFVITRRPHLLVIGNQPEFKTSLVNGTRIILLPSFNDTGKLVLVNLRDLKVKSVDFD